MKKSEIRSAKAARRLAAASAVMLGLSAVLGGCAIFPEEEQERKVQYVETAAEIEYDVEAVQVDSIIQSETIYATYQQTRDEALSYDVDGKTIAYIYVERGDEVEAGDILAQLDVGEIPELLTELNYQIALNERKQADLEELKAYDLQAAALRQQAGWYADDAAYAEAVQAIEDAYRSSMQNYDDMLYLQYMQQELYEEEIAASYLYAGISGTVSYVIENSETKETVAGETVIRIIDTSECYFVAQTKYAELFEDGDIVTVKCGLAEYETTVSRSETDETTVYFTLLDPEAEIAMNAQGSTTLILAERIDVLTVSWQSIHTSGDSYFVYQLDDNGIRKMTEVTIGISGDGKTEITGGLEAGDIVITN